MTASESSKRFLVLYAILLAVLSTATLGWLFNHILFPSSSIAVHAPPSPWRWIFSVLAPIFIAVKGRARGSLAPSGAMMGVLVGFVLTLSNLCFFTSLLTFFLAGSRVTKYGAQRKRQLEPDYKEGGERTWIQVLCNGGVAAYFAVMYMMEEGCGEYVVDFYRHYTQSCLAMSVLGSLASSTGDTFSSELGMVWGGDAKPWLITSFSRVPRGTNGGISVWGTMASAFGGVLIGLAYYLTLLIVTPTAVVEAAHPQWLVIIVAMLAGLVGSLLDSLLGAWFQFSGYDTKREMVVSKDGPDVEHISGTQLLDNHSVNLVTSLFMGFFTPRIALFVYSFVMK